MNRMSMISRQKLIEEVKKQYFAFVQDDTDLWWNRAISAAIEIIESQPPADQWIPCSDPPKEDGMYFITAEVLDKLEVQYVFYQKNLNLFICNGRPIAWMPLPEAYKGE